MASVSRGRRHTLPMRSRAAFVVACVLVGAGVAESARAARAPAPVEVARVGKVLLLAGDEDKQLCIAIAAADDDPDDLDTSCAGADQGVATVGDAYVADGRYVAAVVPAAAASIEVRRAGALVAAGPTLAGAAYKGVRAGSVRFALVALPRSARADGLRVRALDAAGSLVAVVAPEDDAKLVMGRTRLLSGRASGGVRWSIAAELESNLTPSLLDVAHETLSRCVVTTVNGSGRGRVCESGLPSQSVSLLDIARATGSETCGNPRFRLLHGVVDASVMAVRVLLGDGRSRSARTVPVGDGRRAYALGLGDSAVRSVTVPGRGVVRPALPPVSVMCSDGGFVALLLGSDGTGALGLAQLLLDLPPAMPAGPVATIAGSPAMSVADGPADSLCITLAGRPFHPLSCAIVSPALSEPLVAFDDPLDAHALAYAVPSRVAALRFSSADGKLVRTVPTVAGEGYRGRYAGHVRFAAVSFSNPAAFTRLDLLDASGTVLLRDDEPSDTLRVGRPRRVAGRAGAPSLWQTNVRSGKLTKRCLSLTDAAPGPADNCQAARSDAAMLLDASCATHRLSVAIAVRNGTRVVLATGGSTRRPVRLRRGLGLLTLPGGRPLRSVTFIRNGRSRHVEIGAPPAARQCGWRFSPDVEDL